MSDYFDKEHPSMFEVELKNEIDNEPKMSVIDFKPFYSAYYQNFEKSLPGIGDSFAIVKFSINELLKSVDDGVRDKFLNKNLPKYVIDYFKLFNGICINGGVTVSNCSDNIDNNCRIDKEPVDTKFI